MPPTQIKTLRAIHSNSGVAVWYQQQLETLIQSAHLDLSYELAHVFPREPVTVKPGDELDLDPETDTIIAMDAPSPTRRVQQALKRWGAKWAARFDKAAAEIAVQFTARNFGAYETAMQASLKAAGFTVAFKPTVQVANAFRAVLAENVGLIKSIPAQYLAQVQSHVWQAVTRGSDLGTLSNKLQEQYGITSKRAALIARDQNSKAKATIENTRRAQLGIKQAIWQHSSAGVEPRPNHVKWGKEGLIFDVSKGVFDDVAGEWVLPGTLINCRCTSRAIVPGFNT